MSLIKTTEEFREYVSLPGTFPVEKIAPAIPEAQEKFIRPILGEELMADLETWYALSPRPELQIYEALLPHVQRALARFTLFVISPEIDLSVSASGIVVTSNTNLAPASTERVAKFDRSNEQRGWDLVETLLVFLEKNASDYPEWVTSPSYSLAIRNLVNSVTEFNDIFDINNSRMVFNKYRPVMNDADMLKIQPVISIALFQKLMDELKSGNISASNKRILPLLQRAEVYFTVSDRLDRSNYEGIGVQVNLAFMDRDIRIYESKAEAYLSQAIAIIKADIDNYPEYRDSGLYDTTDDSYLNKKENTIYVFGK